MADTIPGDTSSTEILPIGGSAGSAIDDAADSDWFAITLTAGTTYGFALESLELGSDAYLVLRNSGGAAQADAGAPPPWKGSTW